MCQNKPKKEKKLGMGGNFHQCWFIVWQLSNTFVSRLDSISQCHLLRHLFSCVRCVYALCYFYGGRRTVGHKKADFVESSSKKRPAKVDHFFFICPKIKWIKWNQCRRSRLTQRSKKIVVGQVIMILVSDSMWVQSCLDSNHPHIKPIPINKQFHALNKQPKLDSTSIDWWSFGDNKQK